MLVVLAGLLGGLGAHLAGRWGRVEADPLPLGRVERTDLELTIVVGGEVEGSKSTLVECELEDLPGADGSMSSGLTILELIEDGSRVQKGDVLCRFDAAHYEELARLQRIELERAISEERQATLEREAAEAALRAYRDGEAIQIEEELRSTAALAKADLQRARERLEWAEEMLRIRYVSADEFADDKSAALRLELQLDQQERALRTHRKYTVPRTVRELEVAVENAATRQRFGTERREHEQGRFDKLERLVEKCVVRAPHDGMVIHANLYYQRRPDGNETFLRVGAVVTQGMPLFILPDLARPVVQLALHESVASQIKVGMPARIHIPALPGRELTGKVQWVNPVPTEQWRAFSQFQGFDAKVAIDDAPARLLPSLTAQVTIVTGLRAGALVVPTEAVAVEDGAPYCYVSGDGGIERRPVTLAPADRNRVEIVEGLDEGEQVVLDPGRFRPRPDGTIDPFPESPPAPEATARHGAGPPSASKRPT
jgi:HlyD family secretion protein